MEELAKKQCVDGAALLDTDQVAALLARVGQGWTADHNRLSRDYAFPDFISALALVNQIGAIAEQLNHHPDVHLSWGAVRVETWTHSAGGLTENDFILAARIERAAR